MTCAGVMLACALIGCNMVTRWDASASGLQAYPTLQQGGHTSGIRTHTHCLHVRGSGRRQKSSMFDCCDPPDAACECWTADLQLMSQPPAVENSCSTPRAHKAVHYQRGTLVESRPCWQVVLLPGPVLKRPFHIGIHYDQVQNFSQYVEATPSNIKSLVKDVGDFEMELIKVDQSGTQFIWLPMVRPAPSLSSIPPDLPIPFLPYLYFKSQISCNLYAFNIWTSLKSPGSHSRLPSRSHAFSYSFLARCPCKTSATVLSNTTP